MKNNRLNEKIAESVKRCESIILPDRQCSVEGHNATVFLHEDPCMLIKHESGSIILNGHTPATRKSVRLINTVLADYVPERVMTRTGTWYLISTTNVLKEFSGREITLNYHKS